MEVRRDDLQGMVEGRSEAHHVGDRQGLPVRHEREPDRVRPDLRQRVRIVARSDERDGQRRPVEGVPVLAVIQHEQARRLSPQGAEGVGEPKRGDLLPSVEAANYGPVRDLVARFWRGRPSGRALRIRLRCHLPQPARDSERNSFLYFLSRT